MREAFGYSRDLYLTLCNRVTPKIVRALKINPKQVPALNNMKRTRYRLNSLQSTKRCMKS
jgi:hypothetical protein